MTVLPILVRLRIVGTRHDSRSERSLSVFFFFFVQHGVINRRRRVRLKRTLRAHTAATVSFVFALFFFASDPARTVAFCPERIVFLQPFSCNHGRSGVHTKPTSPVLVPPTSRPRPANRENPRSPLPPPSPSGVEAIGRQVENARNPVSISPTPGARGVAAIYRV